MTAAGVVTIAGVVTGAPAAGATVGLGVEFGVVAAGGAVVLVVPAAGGEVVAVTVVDPRLWKTMRPATPRRTMIRRTMTPIFAGDMLISSAHRFQRWFF